MISVNNLSIHFSGNYLFKNATFVLGHKDKVGLVGRNGSGKTTLLKAIAGLQSSETGEVIIPNDSVVGYLPQEKKMNSTKSVYDEAITAFKEILDLKSKIEELNVSIANREDYTSKKYEKLLHELSELNEKYLIIGGNSFQGDTEKVLKGLGFASSDLHNPLSEFSQGWQMRVELAKILLAQPDILLLDEPTNHLDIESIQWLEDFLFNYMGIVILVSHDRAFLDKITNRTIEISDQRIFDYRAGYSEYILMREERLEQQIANYTNQQKQVKQIERFIERFRYKNTKAKQVQSRVKMLERMNEIEIDGIDDTTFQFQFPPAPRSGKVIVHSEKLSKKYDTKLVLDDIEFSVIKSDSIAFVGKNGEGKTTLSKILAGIIEFSGELKYGHNVQIGYYSQDQWDMLDPDKTVFETIDDIATGEFRSKVRNILGGFLFSGESVDKKVKVLSGGEKSRLSLAKLLLTPINFLILDEPTNHLDMQSKDMLKNALLRFDGTLIVVSHDRDFLQGLSNKVFEFRNRNVKEYLGDIYDFLETRRLKSLKELNIKKAGIGSDSLKEVSKNKDKWLKSKQLEKDLRRIKNELLILEQEIEKNEKALIDMNAILANPEDNQKKIDDKKIYASYEQTKARLNSLMQSWEELQLENEKLENEKEALMLTK
ncbi:ATP-binding cassette domain-containing protein [Bacteroidota bacterium]